ncbi:MAG TPA: hypothetical protein VJ385_21390 [Fibrobacteria bacterium]|nr:hypothetical protein [Fibrobacteria bacterium]
MGFALATLLLAGTGMWALQLRGKGDPKAEKAVVGFAPKGLEDVMVRILISGKEYEAGSVANAGPGETLGVAYRSPRIVSAQIWFLEEGGTPQAMSGEGSLQWPAAPGWRPAPVRILLEGDWHRQTVWVITAFSAFTAAEALEAVAGKAPRADLHAHIFKLAQ